MHRLFSHQQPNLEGTGRVEAFSDAVIAIVMTILILEIHVPQLLQNTRLEAWHAIADLGPKLISFALSFLVCAIIWVNHHHFFHPITAVNQKVLWHNNHLLFWTCIIPFATAFVGDYYTNPVVMAIYCFVLFMMALAFFLMLRYVFFSSTLLPEAITPAARHLQFRRAIVGPVIYALATLSAFFNPTISIVLCFFVVAFYFVPQSFTDQVIS